MKIPAVAQIDAKILMIKKYFTLKLRCENDDPQEIISSWKSIFDKMTTLSFH